MYIDLDHTINPARARLTWDCSRCRHMTEATA
ncbi:uncharacterized protein METZ01_LOCUS490247, partial [marine metagenome]